MTKIPNRPGLFLEWRILTSVILCLIWTTSLMYGQEKNLRKQAYQYYESGRYLEAVPIFESYCNSRPKDLEAHFRWAESLYHANKVDQAIKQLKALDIKNRKLDPPLTHLLAKSFHQKHDFRQAITEYKKYLSSSEVKDDARLEVINNIKRCAEGLRYAYSSDEVLIENMGSKVNSSLDDFSPVESPNVESRIYFTSNRNLKVVDRFSSNGQLLQSVQKYDCDMYGTEITNGAWSEAFPLNESLNSNEHEILQDFNEDGSVVVYAKGPNFDRGSFFVDTFKLEETLEGDHWRSSPIKNNERTRGFYFFADSIVLFSANRKKGYGGFDLYISIRNDDGWSEGENLGPKINGPFDDIAPFLAVDGRSLYFSSNRLTSIGGHDIFKSRFSETTNGWESPQNLSMPINSAGDDLYFRISKDGLKAHFSSDRKTGKGGHDLYAAYFKNPLSVQLVKSTPPVYYMVQDFQLFSESLIDDGQGITQRQPKTGALEAELDILSLLYRGEDQILTSQNIPKLENIVGLLKTYPHLEIEILSHSDQSSVSNFDLYFSIKRAEQVAGFLISNGIRSEIIHLKGYGGSYPYAQNILEGKDNETGRFFNRRIDFRIHRADQLPLRLNYTLPQVADVQRDSKLENFYQKREILSYRIQFAELDQLYKGDLISRYPDPSIEKNAASANYNYTSGIFGTFSEALAHLTTIKMEGFSEAKILPYLNGLSLDLGEINEEILQNYPDLKEFVLYLK